MFQCNVFLQVRPSAFDIFESVRSQVHLPPTYTAEDMQRDIVKYMKRDKDELEVSYLVTYMYGGNVMRFGGDHYMILEIAVT